MTIASKKLVAIALVVMFLSGGSIAQVPDKQKVIDGAQRAFERTAKAVKMPAPGCAVGVSLDGESVFEKAFGLAEMEHGIANTPQTIFESGSVAKQFTAAAIVMLAREGKLSIDDPVRKYIPELPDYGAKMTIRHLLNHTAGLRDWGSVMALTGAGRGDRVISQELAIDVILRQRSLDFVPGAEYSYSNSGYQLAALIVERVSKQKFPAFVDERFFKPLGMKNSSTRDDYQRVVPGRAQAYSRNGNEAPWRLDMPFMNVYGNGGMLTTVGDWLKWNAMLDSRSMGAPLVEALETRGVLNDGRKISYALGLVVDDYKGIKTVSHSGSTAGYQTYLIRYPDRKLSVAVLCNGTSPSGSGIAASIADEIFGPFPAPAKPETVAVAEDQLRKYEGSWQNDITRFVNPITLEKGELKFAGTALRPIAGGAFMIGERKMTFTDANKARIQNPDGSVTLLTRVADWKPDAKALAEFAGEWFSEEAQSSFTLVIEGDKAFLRQRPTTSLALRPVTKDHFSATGYVVWITRDSKGKIDGLHIGGGRMRDMPFGRKS